MEKIQESSAMMTANQSAQLESEVFLNENYEFRHNVLSGKVEVRSTCLRSKVKGQKLEAEGQKSKDEGQRWEVLTPALTNSIVLHAKREGIGDGKSPKTEILEYLSSAEVPAYDPIRAYLDNLPAWEGQDEVRKLWSRIPGLNEEQRYWCHLWMRSAVAHWLHLDLQHGNECVPVLIGSQGCGKSTFAYRLLPPELREYYLDHINFGNKFDSEMALTHNLLVNIDEFANMGHSQQGKLKQTLSKVKVNGRPIFGRCQEDRPRYASFLATTNDPHPLCDRTGSRRYLCLSVPEDTMIDNDSEINYPQLYAQLLKEVREGQRYWFTREEVSRIQEANLPYYKVNDVEQMLFHCFRLPEAQEAGQWLRGSEIFDTLSKHYPEMRPTRNMQTKIGMTLRFMGCETKHTKVGQCYQLIPLEKAA